MSWESKGVPMLRSQDRGYDGIRIKTFDVHDEYCSSSVVLTNIKVFANLLLEISNFAATFRGFEPQNTQILDMEMNQCLIPKKCTLSGCQI